MKCYQNWENSCEGKLLNVAINIYCVAIGTGKFGRVLNAVHHSTVEALKCTFLVDMQDDIQKI